MKIIRFLSTFCVGLLCLAFTYYITFIILPVITLLSPWVMILIFLALMFLCVGFECIIRSFKGESLKTIFKIESDL